MSDAASRAPLEVGTIVDSYRITSVGNVDDSSLITYGAVDVRLQREIVLVEVFPRTIAVRAADGVTVEPTSPENAALFQRGLELFQREARALGSLTNPNVALLYGYVLLNGTAYAATEKLNGSSLRDTFQRRGGRIPGDDVRRLGVAMLEGLVAVHDRGIVHGSISPDHVWITPRDRVVLTDFFDARRAWSEVIDVESSLAASPFTAPEQLTGEERGPSIDIYGVGATLYTCITGAPPTRAIGRLLKAQPLPRPRDLDASIPPALDEIVLRALALKPSDRFVGAKEFRDALLNIDGWGTAYTIVGGAATPASSFADEQEAAPATVVDENVQFTVYRPSVVRPNEWATLLAFAHLGEARAGSSGPDPVEEVERQAMRILESRRDDYGKIVQDSSQSVPQEGTLTFAPNIDGVEFNPAQRSFRWSEDVHREEFRFRASPTLNGKVARGRMTVFHGAIILAEIALSIRVDAGHLSTTSEPDAEPVHATAFRRIFASYSHKDLAIVRQFERFASTLGDRYLRDWNELRAGEVWDDRLLEIIRDADVFQLFWSRNAMASPHVRREWEYALSLGRANFIRPTYWEEPLPEMSDGSLPTADLKQLHFQKISVATSEERREAPSRHQQPATRIFDAPLRPTVEVRTVSSGASVTEGSSSSWGTHVGAPPSEPARANAGPSPVPPSIQPSSHPSSGSASPMLRVILTAVILLMLISAIVFWIRAIH